MGFPNPINRQMNKQTRRAPLPPPDPPPTSPALSESSVFTVAGGESDAGRMLGRTVSVRGFCSVIHPRPWLFVGLGNPGEKYRGTRHNVGFDMIDAFAKSLGVPMDRVHCKALFGEALIGETPVFLAKPQTYMNLSGESAGPVAAYYKLPLNRVVLIFDDLNLPCGILRLHQKGGPGGHNGLKSVIQHFRGNREFPRLRVGIGKPPGQMDPKAFLLQKFNVIARERVIPLSSCQMRRHGGKSLYGFGQDANGNSSSCLL